MTSSLVLDSGPLSMACHPRVAKDFRDWLVAHISAGTDLIVAEVIDYELRRELLRANKLKSVQRLDRLKGQWRYLPITTDVMLDAAALWAVSRRSGVVTAVPQALDIDVILAAQARKAGATVVTTNVRHLAHFVEAKHWTDVPVET